MTELSPEARALIAEARRHRAELGPSEEDRARLREKLTPLWAANHPPKVAPLTSRLGLLSVVAVSLALLGWVVTRTIEHDNPHAPRSSSSPSDAGGATDQPQAPSAPRESSPMSAATAPVAVPGPASAPPRAADAPPNTPNTLPKRAATPKHASEQRSSAAARPHAGAATSHEAAATRGAATRQRSAAAQPHPAATTPPAAESPSAAAAAPPRAGRSRSARRPSAPPLDSWGDARHGAAQSPRGAALPNQASGEPTRADVPRTTVAAAREEARSTQPELSDAHGSLREPELRQTREPVTSQVVSGGQTVRTDATELPASIDGEIELLRAAQTALRRRRPSSALNYLQEHAFRFPSGALVDERLAMQALALCALQRPKAAASVLSTLAARSAQSSLLPRVRARCGL